jgi:bifunctional non-homologous end joining protein LigD
MNRSSLLPMLVQNTTRQPYSIRRNRLADVAESTAGRTIQFPANWIDTEPQVVLAASAELGLEGIICKHLDSRYTPGLRSRDWIVAAQGFGEAAGSLPG